MSFLMIHDSYNNFFQIMIHEEFWSRIDLMIFSAVET